jgi:hypothetical protein
MARLQLRIGGDRSDAVSTEVLPGEDVALVDLLDRLLAGGVVLAGDITLAVADIDLVYVGLRALISSVATAEREGLPLP